MIQELVTIEFRYHDSPAGESYSGYRKKIITVGIFDTLEEAIAEGNKALTVLAKHFEVRSDDKFALKALWGMPTRLVTNTCYRTKIEYFAKIEALHFDDLESTIAETFTAYERYKKHIEDSTV